MSFWNMEEAFPENHMELTPDDTINFSKLVILFCTVAGNIVVVDKNDTVITYALLAGQVAPIKAKRVNSTGTTGTVIGLF